MKRKLLVLLKKKKILQKNIHLFIKSFISIFLPYFAIALTEDFFIIVYVLKLNSAQHICMTPL